LRIVKTENLPKFISRDSIQNSKPKTQNYLKFTAMSIIEIAKKTRLSARKLAVFSADAKNQAIEAVAKALEAAAPDIVAANAADCKAAEADGIAKPLYDRLKLDRSKLKSAIAGLRDVAIQKIG
jgi:glutamate-5-semialdehyde dehydrogenase